MPEWSGIITQLETDENDNLVLPFPDELLEVAGWKEGDLLNIDIFAGRLIFQKVEPEDAGGTQLPADANGGVS